MRIWLLVIWLILPLGWAIWHYGPGQEQLKADEAAIAIRAADDRAREGDWANAERGYEDALRLLPENRLQERRKLQLARAKVQMVGGKLPSAAQELKSLVDELAADPTAPASLLADARSTLAQSQYYMTWLMRLEGLPQDEWEPEIDSSRQIYRLVAEQAAANGDAATAAKAQEDLEAAIRLARMDLSDLQGLNLPKQCCGCCSGKGKSPSRGKNKSKSNTPKDARGASTGPPPDGGGH